jgi:hypothetical protein
MAVSAADVWYLSFGSGMILVRTRIKDTTPQVATRATTKGCSQDRITKNRAFQLCPEEKQALAN